LYQQEQCCKSKQTHVKAGDGSDSSDVDDEPVAQSTSAAPPAAAAAVAVPEPEDLCEVCLVAPHEGYALVLCSHAPFSERCDKTVADAIN